MPNLPVDVDSWGRSACYPQGNFCPLSDGASIHSRRITKPYFRTCSTCKSHSQAPLCLYARWLISNQPEGTFGRLRYSLGGDRPSQTAYLPRSNTRFHGMSLGPSPSQSGISPSTPSKLTPRFHSLPPILHKLEPGSMASYSKAPWGLSVLVWGIRIFTDNPISPSLSSRQRSSRYSIRAGRNLPDKEFRYLRTVIVTAAVHRGFGSALARPPLTFRHWAGVSPYTSPCGFAETCVFVKQSLEPFHCNPFNLRFARNLQSTRAPLLPKLRGYFAEFLNESYLAALGILYQPTCVGYAVRSPACSLRSFSRQHGIGQFVSVETPHHASDLAWRIYLPNHPTRLNAHFQSCDDLASCVPPQLKRLSVVQEYQPVLHRLRLSTSA